MNLKEQKKIAEKKLEDIQNRIKSKSTIKEKGETKFYQFSQNNSGGSFVDNEDVCEYVFIEAHSVKEANLLADNFGIYFDGCEQGTDCSCCGDRWYPVSEGDIKPMIYEEDVREIYESGFRQKCIIHYLDGKKEKIIFKTEKDCPKHKYKQQHNIGKKCEVCGKWEKN